MSVQSPYGTSSWAFWPVGDRYQLTPKFGEKYADTDSTVRPQDEENRFDLVGDWGASSIEFTLQLRDMDDPTNPVVPAEEPTITAFLEKTEGWIGRLTLTPEFIYETPTATEWEPDPAPVWTGDLKFTIDQQSKDWVGYGRPVRLTVDAEFPSDAPSRIRVGYGSLLLRR